MLVLRGDRERAAARGRRMAALPRAAARCSSTSVRRWRRWCCSVAHVVMHHRSARRRWRPLLRRTDLTRRRALLGTGVVAGSAALWVIAPGLRASRHRIARGRLGEHRRTFPSRSGCSTRCRRSRPAAWRLRTPDRSFDLAAIAALPQSTVRAVLDCTGGWFTEQEWRGVPLSALGLRQGASIEVVSTTGYRRRFPAREAGTLLLATHASGRPLSAGHGGPARIVAPGRRGFWWVKWVVSIEVVDEPWWWQPPFPLAVTRPREDPKSCRVSHFREAVAQVRPVGICPG